MHMKRGSRLNPLYQAFIDAGKQAGYPVTEDYNGHQQEGFGPMEMTVHNGFRWSAANAYLRPARATKRVKLVTYAYAERLILEGRKAVGVSYPIRSNTSNIPPLIGVATQARSPSNRGLFQNRP